MNDQQASIIQQIIDERDRQDAKWGVQNHDDYTWLAILAEEIGESAQVALHDEFGGHAVGNLCTELIQVAAVTLAWLENIKRRVNAPTRGKDESTYIDPTTCYTSSAGKEAD